MVSRIVILSRANARPMALIIFGSVADKNLRSQFSQNRRLVRFFHF